MIVLIHNSLVVALNSVSKRDSEKSYFYQCMRDRFCKTTCENHMTDAATMLRLALHQQANTVYVLLENCTLSVTSLDFEGKANTKLLGIKFLNLIKA